MKLKFLENASGMMSRTGFKLKQASPDILVVVGVVGVVVSTVMACKATLKVDDILTEHEEKVKEIEETVEDPKYADRYSKEDCETDKKTMKVKTGVKLAKLYAPAIIIGAVSIGCIVGSHYILQKRNAGLLAAYTVLDNSYKEYRKRVAEKYGKDAENDIRHGIKRETIVETIKDENGEERQEERIVESRSPNEFSRLFDCTCDGWENNAPMNWFTLRNMQNLANHKLQVRGYLFLNELYDILKMPHCVEGQYKGWIRDTDDPTVDNYVDLRIGEEPNEDDEADMWITPNVQGIIINKLKWRRQ